MVNTDRTQLLLSLIFHPLHIQSRIIVSNRGSGFGLAAVAGTGQPRNPDQRQRKYEDRPRDETHMPGAEILKHQFGRDEGQHGIGDPLQFQPSTARSGESHRQGYRTQDERPDETRVDKASTDPAAPPATAPRAP